MPADSKAKRYEWYMTQELDIRIVRMVWTPEGEIVSSMTPGQLVVQRREMPDDEWETMKATSAWGPIPWVIAQNVARDQGFNVEVACYDDD